VKFSTWIKTNTFGGEYMHKNNIGECDIELENSQKKLTYTVPEAASLLNVSPAFVYRMVNQNQLPVIRLGKRVLISIKKLEAFINQ